MPNIRKVGNHKSLFASAVVGSVVCELVQEIKKYLDENQEFEFEQNVNRSFANEEMRMIAKKNKSYVLITFDNLTGCEYYEHEIEDCSQVSVYDLIWVMEQIELEEGV